METRKDLIGRFSFTCSALGVLAILTAIWGSDFFALVSFGIVFATLLLGWSVKEEITLGHYLIWVALLSLSLLNLRGELVSQQAFSLMWFTEHRHTLLIPVVAVGVTVGMSMRFVLEMVLRVYGSLKG